jgi:hypothetical protein
MESNNIIALLFIIIIFFIVTDYCKNKHKVESFEENIEENINNSIKALKEERNNLVDTINNPDQKKYNNKAEYLTNIKKKINEILINETETRIKLEKKEEDKIKTIKNKLRYLHNYININVPEKKFNSVKSLHNGTKLSIKEIEGNSHYLVKLNNDKSILDNNDTENCLSVKANGTYEIEKCNPKNDQQYFNLQNIPNEITYKKHLEKGIFRNKNIPANVNYPFNLIKSVNNKNCLQNFNNQISVSPCETKKSHRWEPLEEQIYCSRDEN